MKTICERGKICIFLKKEISIYSYPLYARSEILKSGEQLNYYCCNPKKLDNELIEKLLTHEEKYRKCGYKATDKLEVFFK